MSSLAEDNQNKIDALAHRMTVMEQFNSTRVVKRKDVNIVVVCAVTVAIVIMLGFIAEVYMIYQADKLYSLLKSV